MGLRSSYIPGRYEVQGVFGRVYKWHPEQVVLECGCGERPSLTGSRTACECGAEHAAVAGVWLAVRRRKEAACS